MSYKNGEPGANPVERICCPLCGWIRTVKARVYQRTTPYYEAGEPRKVHFDVDVEHAPIWRLDWLSGKGQGSREAKIELVDSKTLAELPAELKEQIIRQCHKILEILK